ncbi:hypothetical protein V8D89_015745 [Ganoderma adspersum]
MLRHVFAAAVLVHSAFAAGPQAGQIKNLVTFGDSYTDINAHADGGTTWPVFASQEGKFKLFSFAKAGAMCSSKLIPHGAPPVVESQLPKYFAAKSNGTLAAIKEDETMYTLWIGTNDVGPEGLLTGKQAGGVTLVDTVSCAVNWVQTLYNSGARNFIFQNMVPLEAAPLYLVNSYPNHYWTASRNTTEWHQFVKELTNAGNAIARLKLQLLAPTLSGAHIGFFDSHALFTDIYRNPKVYLNGTAPLNVTGAVHSCIFKQGESVHDTGVCTIAKGTDQDSFLWYDELHPSVQTERVVAKAISDVILRKSEQWITWLS